MIEPKDLENLAQQLSALLPEDISGVGEELQSQFRDVARKALTKLELVSREEFDVQRKVLARTRAKVDALEQQIADLELQLRPKSS